MSLARRFETGRGRQPVFETGQPDTPCGLACLLGPCVRDAPNMHLLFLPENLSLLLFHLLAVPL